MSVVQSFGLAVFFFFNFFLFVPFFLFIKYVIQYVYFSRWHLSSPSHRFLYYFTGAHKGEGLGNKFLSNIRGVSLVLHVVRCFDNIDVIHVENSIDPVRDIEVIETELILADLATVEKRLSGIRNRVGCSFLSVPVLFHYSIIPISYRHLGMDTH